jgi:hypothetical protein
VSSHLLKGAAIKVSQYAQPPSLSFYATGRLISSSPAQWHPSGVRGFFNGVPGDLSRVGGEPASPGHSQAVEVAAVDSFASGAAPRRGSDFPWHTCIADRRCRIVSAIPIWSRRPSHCLSSSLPGDRSQRRLQHLHPDCHKQRQ